MKQYPVKTLRLGNGESIAYREGGRGEKTLVFIHGNMSSSVHWQPLMEALENEYHIIAPDMRGFGDSSYLERFNSLRELAEDMQEVLALLNIQSFTALGWSTGGGVVLEMAANLAGHMEKAILLDSVPPTGYPMYKKDASGQPVVSQPLKTKEEIAADPVQVAPVLAAYASNNRDLLRIIWNAAIYNLKQPSPEDYEIYLDAIFKQRNLVDIDYSLMTFNMTDTANQFAPGSGRLAKIKCPVVLLHGEEDLVVPLEWARMAQGQITGSRLITFPNVGHSALTDDLKLLVDTLRSELG